ncbi:sigma-70 family RNA polymerase sigma factor [Pseudonocardia sp. KRD-182]|uniref:sigma factor-like helix-turn-helix DNA-binding protein n=1 Tax=Pseudonocardia oceani TaxID=2792013 RepID=UPI001C49DDC1|nr:sigma factor-like helix-turn-helix DNA-binding protein [Pseudonocardia oceani]MBW0110470.1 sigma-70 family RNA polymerase sigma factor [Pseudonocardia oceani]
MSSGQAVGGSTAEQPDVAALYHRYGPAMQRVAASVLAGTEVDPSDAVMQVVVNLQAMHSVGALRGIENWEAYLVASVRNEARRVAGKAANESPVDDARIAVLLETMSSDAADDIATDRVEAQRRLDRLDTRRRAIIESLYIDDRPLAEVAAQWEITPQRTGQLRDQALRTMREE